MSDGMVLSARDLGSKFGLNDGEMPEWLADRLGGSVAVMVDWHDVLWRMVWDRLLPLLPRDALVYRLETGHNPVRCHSWTFDTAPDIEVTVPWGDVMVYCFPALEAFKE